MKGLKKRSTLNKFLMSLLATTVSIVLTFGTTAIIDRKKQKAQKREMVLMLMYDMRESLKEIEDCEKTLKKFCDVQVDLVAHPDKFDDGYVNLMAHIPILFFTNTTENIFKSNIETINTLGNILFVETVSSFYVNREKVRTEIVEKFQQEGSESIGSYEALAAFDAISFPFFGDLLLSTMQRDFEQCKLMMKVSEEELDVFSEQRKKLLDALPGEGPAEMVEKITRERNQRRQDLQRAREEGRKAISQ